MPVSPHFARFLATEDLDDLLDARSDLGPVTPDDEQVARTIMREWRNEQAVSNLLMHPGFIPDDIRMRSLIRGLDEREEAYYILAAVVGVQSIRVSGEERLALRDRLLNIVEIDSSIIAKRATVSLENILTPDDGPLVARLLEHPDDCVRHNLLSWLVTTFDPERSRAVYELIRASGISEEAQADIELQIADYVQKRRTRSFNPLDSSLLGYIPNLSETR